MANRNQFPKWVKQGKAKPLSDLERAKSLNPMNFRKGKARKKRPDTGKKITKGKSNTPNIIIRKKTP